MAVERKQRWYIFAKIIGHIALLCQFRVCNHQSWDRKWMTCHHIFPARISLIVKTLQINSNAALTRDFACNSCLSIVLPGTMSTCVCVCLCATCPKFNDRFCMILHSGSPWSQNVANSNNITYWLSHPLQSAKDPQCNKVTCRAKWSWQMSRATSNTVCTCNCDKPGCRTLWARQAIAEFGSLHQATCLTRPEHGVPASNKIPQHSRCEKTQDT